MSSVFRTATPYGVTPTSHPDGIDARGLQHYIVGDEKGRLVVVIAPDAPPPDQNVQTDFEKTGTGAVLKRFKQLVAFPCYAVTIRNKTNKEIRVSRRQATDDADFDAMTVLNTISPSFSKRLLCKNADEFFIARDDGLAAAEIFAELTYEVFTP